MRAANLGWALGTMLALTGCGGGSGPETVSAKTAEESATTTAAALPSSSAASGGSATASPDPMSPQPDASGSPAAGATGGQARRPVTLTWQLPDRNEDGSKLETPPKVRVHYGRASRKYAVALVLPQPGAQRHVFTSLEPGTWFLAVTSIGSDGIESELSDEAVAVVN